MRPAADPPAGSAAAGRAAVRAEIHQIRRDFRRLVTQASATDLRLPSAGTKWSNQQLLFHMLFGYLIVRGLLPLARFLGRRPRRASVALACLLNCAQAVPPDQLPGLMRRSADHPPARMPGVLDRVTGALRRRLQQETDGDLGRGDALPDDVGPVFRRVQYMTVAELYR
jgi:hypothetical protein